MPMPAGVTVRPFFTERPAINRPRNVLERAALCSDRAEARDLICEALGIDPASPLAQTHLTWPERWARLSECGRLMEIAEWLRAEAYECMDLVEGAAISTLGD